MTNRPVVYLDVDGVLNAWKYHTGTPPKDCYTDFELVERGWDLYISQDMGKALLEATQGAEVIWCTTWCEKAAAVIAPLFDFPDWEWFPLGYSWKTDAIINHQLRNPRPLVWIDDDEMTNNNLDRFHATLAGEGRKLPPHLLITPTPRTGLRPSEIEKIADFVKKYTEG